MLEIVKSCEYLYNSIRIPIYLYQNSGDIISCFPNQEKYTHPFPKYLKELLHTRETISFIETEYLTYYGSVKIENNDLTIILGPINPFPYTKQILSNMQNEFMTESSKSEQFKYFFLIIPPQNLDTFISILLLTNSLLNNTHLSKSQVRNLSHTDFDHLNYEYLYTNTEVYSEERTFNINYEIEQELYHYIETGNLEKLNTFYENTSYKQYDSRNTAFNYLRQKKNGFIMGISLMSRSAIKGGLSPKTAYELMEIYIKQQEPLTEVVAIDSLLVQATYDFTRRTANAKIPEDINKFLYTIMKYVNDNIYRNITVSEIAAFMHFNRSYLSHRFKKEYGMGLGTYIQSRKLEEGKSLLKYSTKSISEISNLLSFSSQSHFQNSFKRTYNITPQAYRNSKL